MPNAAITRRTLFESAAFTGFAFAIAPEMAVAGTKDRNESFDYEVTRSDAEWRAMLEPEVYRVLREGGTERKHSSPLVRETRDGTYSCRGCDLTLYENIWKVPLEIGWVFFRHSRPNSLLTAVDGPPFDPEGNDIRILAAIEVHCRRCGSHQGHIVHAEGQLVHCINGSSMNFEPATT
jgi:peptide-methionine (R)-S-oxide reductase